jgi:hypothetical protein
VEFGWEESFQLSDECLRVNRLGQVAVETGGENPFAIAGHGKRGYRNQWNGGSDGLLAETARELEPFDIGKVNIADDEIGREPAALVDAVLRGFSGEHTVAEGSQQIAHQLAIGGLVVHNQDASACHATPPPAAA